MAPMISPKKIKTIGDRCLRVKSEEVEFDKDEMTKLYAEMCQAMWMANGIGLAAPQIGVNKRVIIVDETTEEHGKYAHLMVNPKITWKSEEKVLLDEGCLSEEFIKSGKKLISEYESESALKKVKKSKDKELWEMERKREYLEEWSARQEHWDNSDK